MRFVPRPSPDHDRLGLIALETGTFLDLVSVKKSRARTDKADVSPTVMRDSQHACPEYVWGDEGPVNE
jgi:hypothetical protein